MSTRRLLPLAGIAMALLGQLAVAGTATVYYYKPYKNWASANVHSNASGNWTAVPGTAMTLACTNWYSKALTTGTATTFQATFTNGAGQWDNVDNVPGYNFVIPNTGTHQIKNGQLLANIGSPCGTDATAPTAPNGLKTTAIAATSVTLAWTAAADNFSVAGYDIYRGTTKVGTATTTSYTNTGLTASTTYSYTVKARDAAGKISAASTALSVKPHRAPRIAQHPPNRPVWLKQQQRPNPSP